jgi:hypothetical protein
MKRILLFVLFATTSFAQGGPSHDTLECDPAKNKCSPDSKVWIVSPSDPFNRDVYMRTDSSTHHIMYAKNGGPEFDIDAAYQKFLTDQPNPKEKPHRTGKFHLACTYEMSDGSHDFDACPDVAAERFTFGPQNRNP